MPTALSLAKRALFGGAHEGKTVTELYASAGAAGGLSDKARRQALVNGAKLVLRLFTWPAALLLWLRYRATRPLPGDCLYTLARRDN
jgi:hypothetical protein